MYVGQIIWSINNNLTTLYLVTYLTARCSHSFQKTWLEYYSAWEDISLFLTRLQTPMSPLSASPRIETHTHRRATRNWNDLVFIPTLCRVFYRLLSHHFPMTKDIDIRHGIWSGAVFFRIKINDKVGWGDERTRSGGMIMWLWEQRTVTFLSLCVDNLIGSYHDFQITENSLINERKLRDAVLSSSFDYVYNHMK